MANRIKGITVEIGGDTTKLSKALEGVNKDIKGTQTQLKDVQKLLKLDPTNTELLSQKHKLLADAVSATKEKLEVLKTAAEQANTALANGEISQQQAEKIQHELSRFSVSADDEWISILVDEEKSKVMEVLSQLQQSYEIRDMQLEEISTEEVIKKIYEEGVQ